MTADEGIRTGSWLQALQHLDRMGIIIAASYGGPFDRLRMNSTSGRSEQIVGHGEREPRIATL